MNIQWPQFLCLMIIAVFFTGCDSSKNPFRLEAKDSDCNCLQSPSLTEPTPAAPAVPQLTIKFNAWVGENDTLLAFPPEAQGFELYRASEPHCDSGNYQSCQLGQADIVAGEAIVDSAATVNQAGFYQLQYNQLSSNEVQLAAESRFSARKSHQAIVFKSKLWVIGGYGKRDRLNDVW